MKEAVRTEAYHLLLLKVITFYLLSIESTSSLSSCALNEDSVRCGGARLRENFVAKNIFTFAHIYSSAPLILMTVAYFQIVRVLWKSDTIPGHRESRTQTYTCGCKYRRSHYYYYNYYYSIPNLQSTKYFRMKFIPNLIEITDLRSGLAANSSTMGQLRARRKAAKMLVAVVVMFAICYFPVHFLNILR